MKTVLITGITGFLGCHIAENLINDNYIVIGLKRQQSNIWRCDSFKDKIIWIDIDDNQNYKKKLLKFNIDIIHIIEAIFISCETAQNPNIPRITTTPKVFISS